MRVKNVLTTAFARALAHRGDRWGDAMLRSPELNSTVLAHKAEMQRHKSIYSRKSISHTVYILVIGRHLGKRGVGADSAVGESDQVGDK